MNTPTYLTTGQVAARLGKSVSQVNRMVNAGKLKPDVEVPGKTGSRLYSAATVLAFIEGEGGSGGSGTEERKGRVRQRDLM